MFVKDLKKDFSLILDSMGVSSKGLEFEHPNEEAWGDYSTNIALKTKVKDLTSFDLAGKIIVKLREKGLASYIGKIDTANPGFINVWIKREVLGREMVKALEQKDRYGSSDLLKGKKILLEHTSPNPQTTIMLGHLRNNFLGMAVSRI
ncbi:hypothetical protein KKF11_03725, partial [Patescibacteria group bacterium]|nr:hypothetical protein [Patescibacteria group bacterium]